MDVWRVSEIESNAMKKLLLVCRGNICRSPMAQAVVQKMALDAGLSKQFKFDSAGTHTQRVGERPDPRATQTLLRRGYETGRIRSRKIAVQDFAHFDLILAMDANNLADLRQRCSPENQGKLRLFLEFAEGLAPTEIPDPYYGNAEGFERVLDLCEAGAKGLIKHLA